MTNPNQQLSSFYNVKDEFCWEEEKPGDRKNENKPTKSYETVKEGFYQDDEEENCIEEEKKAICSRKNLKKQNAFTMTVVGIAFLDKLKFL